MQGEALTTFNNKTTTFGAETLAHWTQCFHAVVCAVFGPCTLARQKRYMRRYMRKPRDMTTRQWMNRVKEMNDYLQHFPDANPNVDMSSCLGRPLGLVILGPAE